MGDDSRPVERSVYEQGQDRLRESRQLLDDLDDLLPEPPGDPHP
jgi:hypothetical protein